MKESRSSPRQVQGCAMVFFSWEQNSLWSISRLSLYCQGRGEGGEGKEGKGDGEVREGGEKGRKARVMGR